MTEEIKTCDFYNDKICNLFTEYFKFKVECENLSLCTVDDDTEKECPYKQLKRLEQERDELKFENDRYKQLLKGCPTEDEDCGLCVIDEQNKRLKQENRWQRDEEKYLKECCIKAGKELEKNSFAWDGKEKNLVVQALELNKRYEILKQENKDLKKTNRVR